MAIVSVNETFEGQEPPSLDARARDYTRVFNIQVDSLSDLSDPATLTAQDPSTLVQIPSIADPHPTDTKALVRSIRPETTDNPLIFRFVVRYSTQTDFAGFGQDDFSGQPIFQENPLLRKAEVSFSFTKREVVADFGYDRDEQLNNHVNGLGFEPILNSAGQPFDPPLTVNKSDMRMTWTQNFAAFPIQQAIEYADAVNFDSFTLGTYTVNPFTAKVDSIVGTSHYESGQWFWSTTYTIDFRVERWIPTDSQNYGPGVVYDTGRAERIEDPANPGEYISRVITDAQGYSMSEPVPLDGSGMIKTTPDPGTIKITPAVLRFSLYKIADFSLLGIF